MIINQKLIKELEARYRRHLAREIKEYLLVKYGQEPFPYEFSEQDLYTNIDHDIHFYETGELDVTIKSPSERWHEEREYLQNLYIAKAREAKELATYVADLERRLAEHGLKSAQMANRALAKPTNF